MRYHEFLFEYIKFDQQKLQSRLKNDSSNWKQMVGAKGQKFISFLEANDPTEKKKYVNWMISRYLKGGIQRLEDIPSKVKSDLNTFDRLLRTKKLKPEHRDIGKIKSDLELYELLQSYSNEDVKSKQEEKASQEQSLYDSGDAKLIYNDNEWKVVIPITHKASCYFGKNTRWCTTTANNTSYHDQYSKQGPLYIILHKPTNKRWQFHFESGQYMDELDEEINLVQFLRKHSIISNVFQKLGYVELLKNDGYKIGNRYYNRHGLLHREDGPAKDYGGYQEWRINGKLHREDGPAIIWADGTKYWWLNDKGFRFEDFIKRTPIDNKKKEELIKKYKN